MAHKLTSAELNDKLLMRESRCAQVEMCVWSCWTVALVSPEEGREKHQNELQKSPAQVGESVDRKTQVKHEESIRSPAQFATTQQTWK